MEDGPVSGGGDLTPEKQAQDEGGGGVASAATQPEAAAGTTTTTAAAGAQRKSISFAAGVGGLSEGNRPGRSDSASSAKSTASRRSTLPPSLSGAAPLFAAAGQSRSPSSSVVGSKDDSGLLGGRTTPSGSTASASAAPAAKKRASIAGGMMTAPFQQRETARWRPITTDMLTKSPEEREHEEYVRELKMQEAKPIRQRIFEKTAVSLTIQLLVLLACSLVGTATSAVLRWDLGTLAFWGNQGFIVWLFLGGAEDVRPLAERVQSLPPFGQATLAAQGVALAYTVLVGGYWNPLSAEYATLVKALMVQVAAKLAVMLANSQVVDTVL